MILTGLRPAIAQTLIHLGIDLTGIKTSSSLAVELQMALKTTLAPEKDNLEAISKELLELFFVIVRRTKVAGKRKLEKIIGNVVTDNNRITSLEILQNLVEKLPVAVAISTPEGRSLYQNPARVKMQGFGSSDKTAGNYSPAAVNYDDPKDRERFVELLSKGPVTDFEVMLRRKDGTTFWASLTARLEKDETGNPSIITVSQDIDERKKKEKALVASEEKFRYLVENLPISLSITAPDGSRLSEPNRATLEMYGFETKEEYQKVPDNNRYYDPEDRRRWIETAAKGTVKDFELRLKRKDGSVFWASRSCAPMKGEYEEQRIVITQDITERKKAEEAVKRYQEHLEELAKERTSDLEKANNGLKQEIAEHEKAGQALRASEEKYRTLVDNIPVGVSVGTTDGQIIERNKAIMAMFGFESKEEALTILAPATYFEPKDRLRLLELLKKGQVNNFEVQRKRKDGSAFWVSMAAIPEPGDPENKLIIVTEDINERKRAEEEQVRQGRELEMANVELSAVNKELEAFSYSVSHDLRAPLRSIDGFSQILLEEYGERFGGEGKDYLKRVRQASQRMGVLIDDVLGLSRVTRSEMHVVSVDLSALANLIVNELRIAQPDQRVDVVIEPGLTVEGDANLLRIMLTNLLDNAWKFTAKHPQAKIEFGKTIRDGKEVFFVRDDGAGFDMAYANKLFQPFQRLHGLNEFEGTGIGLATAQRVINRHGGRVWAEGAVEKGATFYFSI